MRRLLLLIFGLVAIAGVHLAPAQARTALLRQRDEIPGIHIAQVRNQISLDARRWRTGQQRIDQCDTPVICMVRVCYPSHLTKDLGFDR